MFGSIWIFFFLSLFFSYFIIKFISDKASTWLLSIFGEDVWPTLKCAVIILLPLSVFLLLSNAPISNYKYEWQWLCEAFTITGGFVGAWIFLLSTLLGLLFLFSPHQYWLAAGMFSLTLTLFFFRSLQQFHAC